MNAAAAGMPAPMFCLVTDRRGLAAHLGSADDPLALLERQASAAIDAGVDIVHVRERDMDAGALADLVSALAARARGGPTRVVVNDRLDVALAAGASGVHLRGDSVPTARVRATAPPGLVVGRSVHGAAEAAREAEAGADYLVLGTIFGTPSKPGDHRLVGLEALRQASAAATAPVIAIGGVSEERIPAVAATGASGVAAIRLFWDAGLDAREIARALARWRAAFDLHRPIS